MGNKKCFAVMLVDDNEIDNLINSKIIETTGISEVIYMHSTAISAIDFLKNIRKISTEEDNKLPEFIFLDIDMPMMDGFQFIEEFNSLDPFITKYCKVVMLTASMNPKDKMQASKSDALIKYLNKPLREADVKAL